MSGPSQARPGVIAKSEDARRAATIPDLDAYRASFTWEAARQADPATLDPDGP